MAAVEILNEIYLQLRSNYLLLGAVGASLLALVLNCINYARLNRLQKKYGILTRGLDRKNIEELLASYTVTLEASRAQNAEFAAEMNRLKDILASCVQHVGTVRYSAFEGVGSDLSFSAAFLDGNLNGVVVTSIFGRDESRTYAKPVANGASTYTLTEEEQEAVRLACASKTLSRRITKKGIRLFE